MNRCKTKRWMAMAASVIMLVSILACAVTLYADTAPPYESSYILKVNFKQVDRVSGVQHYNVTVRLMGDSDIATALQATLENCTFVPKDDMDVTKYLFDISQESTNDDKSIYEIIFNDVKDSKNGNNLVFSVRHPVYNEDGTPSGQTVKEYISYDMSELLRRPGTGSSSSEEPDEDTPIAALKPHLIVDSYSYGEASAGKDVPVTFTLKNTSASKTIRNVVLTVKASGDLRIKSASDTIFVDSILPGKTITKSMNFFLGAGVKTDVQDISISSTFEYFDIEGRDAVAGGDNITISIPTDTVDRVRIQKAELPEMLYPGSEEEITYSVINAGFNTLYNCEIKVVDEEGTEYAYAYVGSLDPSKSVSETYLPIVFDTPGEKNLKFVFTYENEKLQTGEVTRDFKASVMEMPIYEEPPINPFPEEPMPEEPQGMAPWLLWVLIGGGVLVAVIVTVVVIKAVKKKRGELDDEDI